MKRNIAIVAGGDTSEIVVSLRSAQGIYSFIDKEKYNLYIVEMEGRRWEVQLPDGNKVPVDRNDFSFTNGTEKVVFDFAYITIHGTPGEDGRLQGYFDMMRIPYSCCGVLAAAITYDKFTCNQYLKAFGVRIAESFDYDAKYNGQVDEITPARISDELTKRVQMLTSAIYDILGCSGIIRVDYIVTAGEKLNLLEVNTTPGMTTTSFIPQQVRAAGLDIKDVMTDIWIIPPYRIKVKLIRIYRIIETLFSIRAFSLFC